MKIFSLISILIVLVIGTLAIAEETDEFGKYATDAVLLSTLPQSLASFPPTMFTGNKRLERIAIQQLKPLIKKYKLIEAGLRDLQIMPKGVFAKYNGNLLIFVTNNVWFDPVSIGAGVTSCIVISF